MLRFSTRIQRHPCRLLKMESMKILDNSQLSTLCFSVLFRMLMIFGMIHVFFLFGYCIADADYCLQLQQLVCCVVADSDILVHPASVMAGLLMIDTVGIIVGGKHI